MNPTPKLSRLVQALAAAVFIGLAPAAAVAQTTAPATTDAPAAAAPALRLRPPLRLPPRQPHLRSRRRLLFPRARGPSPPCLKPTNTRRSRQSRPC